MRKAPMQYWTHSQIGEVREMTISQQLQKELPGLRGFSATNIKNMRSFYEEWSPFVNCQPMADENKTLTAVSDSELNSLIAVELKSGKFLLHIWGNYHIEALQ